MTEHEHLPTELLTRIDEICDRFHAAWEVGERPRIEDFLSDDRVPTAILIRELLATEMELLVRAGQPIPVEDYLSRFSYPGLVASLYREIVPQTSDFDIAFASEIRRLQQLRDYQLLEKIGEGGFSTVYKAVHTKLGKTVALKILPPDRWQEPTRIARFEREMLAVGALDHPNIVRATDAGEVDGCHYLVMEFVDGPTLASLVKAHGPLPIREACELIRQAAVALDAAHAIGLVHRDVKPANFILDGIRARQSRPAQSGLSSVTTIMPSRASDTSLTIPTLKMLDLGLARLHGQATDLTTETQMVGTVDYMAPEQARRGGEIGPPADIYGLGCTLFTLLAGRAPFGDDNHASVTQKILAHVEEPLPSLEKLRPDIPPALVSILQRMTAKKPEQRFPSAAAVAEALSPLAAGANLYALQAPSSQNETPSTARPVDVTVAYEPSTAIASVSKKRKWLLLGTATLLCLLLTVPVLRAGRSWRRARSAPTSTPDRSSRPANDVNLTATDIAKSSDYEWNEPENLGAVNSPSLDTEPVLSDDGLLMVFVSGRPGGLGSVDLWQTTRPAVDSPWSEPVNLGAPVNSKAMDFGPSVSPDGLNLWFNSNRTGKHDIYHAARSKRDERWSDAVSVGPTANSSLSKTHPHVMPDGLTLLFDVNSVLWHSRRSHQQDQWGAAAEFDPVVIRAEATSAWLSSDRRLIYFDAQRLGGYGSGDLWMSQRESAETAWAPPTNLGPPINTAGYEGGAFLAPDCRTLYFHSESNYRSEGHGDLDIYLSRRVPKATPAVKLDPSPPPRATEPSAIDRQTLINRGKQQQREWAEIRKLPVEVENSIGMKFRLVPPGDFLMGLAESEPNTGEDKPQHAVTISSAFFLASTEVTVGQFRRFVEETGYKTTVEQPGNVALDVRQNPLPGVNWQTAFGEEQPESIDSLPVVCVSWHDAGAFCQWLSSREGLTYRLPTDAEWEYACRAGSTTPYWWGSEFSEDFIFVPTESNLPRRQTVGSYPPNPFGLFDMHGNVWEWCRDARRTYSAEPVNDPVSLGDPSAPRVVRGGAFSANPLRKRSGIRAADAPEMATPVKGFRVLREVDRN